MSFEFLGLSEEVMSAVADAGYIEPTPIQRQAIPSILMGRDVLGIAQTGTGKTAGFTLPMIDILAAGKSKARMPRSLILEPTRELAAQVAESFEKYGKNNKLSMALLIGGVSFSDQVRKLDRGVDVLIATPGRLLDHFERGKLMLNGVQILVVDEADRMLDMGFIPDVERICKLVTQKPQSLFFSATMPPPIKSLTDRFLDDPKLIQVAPPATAAETVSQKIVNVGPRDKAKALKALLGLPEVTNALVFCNRKVEVSAVYKELKRGGMNVAQLHGDMAQSDRMEVLQNFKDSKIEVLIASDVAARGLDILAVSHVFNYDVPFNPEDYVHRIGRTGRAGREGTSITIATPKDSKSVEAIWNLIGVRAEPIQVPGLRNTPSVPPESREEKAPGGRRERAKGPRRRRGHPAHKPAQQSEAQSQKKTGPKTDQQRDDQPRPHKATPPRQQSKKVGLGDHVPAFLRTDDGKG
jgi:superfamily II DNA/RNA helicase